ncbi:CBS domain-containing protein [Amphritea balenae]|uniref:CBS domain-containing protein n=1 Tax=Amphritea balenae TaxID=452629 RepID=A0A3P1SJB7_9GAMM|nr:CBS domain-containing protein [Amphritea balenae]RRC96959.1 CBS domain-containing protein [Amphritea balenae]GGK85348.1 CBS domain-containing protein [Amphritea balenae]
MTTLSQLTAGQIMSKELLTAEANWSVKTLIEFLSKHKVTGAPVVSSTREIKGVVSLSDILKLDTQPEAAKKANIVSQYYMATLEGYTADELGLKNADLHSKHLVQEIMTADIISVTEDTTLPAIAKLMSDKSIHRVFVSNNDGLSGVISTLDILRQLADS